MERKAFTKQTDPCLTNSKERQLQQRWQELNERELSAKQHNKELLQQFEEAEETLKQMLACTAAMKTIRIEYERYLKESSHHWQQQLKEKTQAAQRMNTKEAEVTKAYADQRAQGSSKRPQDVAEAQRNIHSDYNQHGSSYHPYVQASWLTHPLSQSAESPMRASHQPQSSSHVLPSFHPHPHPFMLPHLTPTPSQHPWPRQNAPGWCSLQTDSPWSWTAGAAGLHESLWGRLYNKEPPPDLMVSQPVAQRPETSGASGSKSERCGGRRTSCLSQELDVKPVRLSSGQAESSESGRDSSQVIRERRKKRGRSQCASSEPSSRSSSAVVTASAAVSQGSEADAFSGKCHIKVSKKTRQRSGAQVAEPLQLEKVLKENNRNKGDETVSQFASRESGRQTEESTGENTGNSSADEHSEECREELGSLQLKSKTGDEKQKQEIISSEPSSSEEKDEDDKPEIDLGQNHAEEEENSPEDDCQDADVEEEETDPEEKDKSLKEEQDKGEEVGEGEVSAERQTTEEEETGAEDETEEQECDVKEEPENDNCDKRRSASSQDEDESEQEAETDDEEESDEEEHGETEEEQLSDKESEPEDGAKKNRAKRRHIIPEEAAENDNEKTGNKTGFTDNENISEDDDIENLLAPEEQRKKRQDLNAAEKPKVSNMKIFQVDDGRSTQISPQHSDCDESDHFYD